VSNIEQFGKYILLEKLATGGMAEVYLAKSSGADGVQKFVAIKRILPQYSDNDEFIEMFREEAKIAVNMKHNNVVSIYEFGIEDKQFYLVMEYVEGFNLRQILNHLKKSASSFSMEQIVFMIKEVAAGLDHAHRCLDSGTGKPLNIIHRDMSPQNVMISFEGEVKVVDFGIAKTGTNDDRTKAGTLKGKFGYMSPEQADGQNVDSRTDIFSMGIVLWELLANARLFTADSEHAILRKIRECQITNIRSLNPAVPPELERIVHKALAKDKSLRYQRASDFQRDLNRFLNTKYPDFSPQDFSIFMKTVFGQEFLELRKRIVEFAKAQVTIEHVPPVSSKSVQEKEMELKAKVPGESPSPPQAKPELPNKMATQTGAAIPPSHTQKNLKPESRPVAQESQGVFKDFQKPKFTPPPPPPKAYTQTSTRLKQTQTNYKRASGGDFLSSLMTFVIIIAVGGAAAFVAMKKGIKVPFLTAETRVSTDANGKKVSTKGQIDLAQIGTYVVSVQSVPSGAAILVNGQPTGSYSPAQITVEANKEFSLGLRKEGFFPYETTLMASENASSFKAQLQPMLKTGYVSLNVVNGGNSPIVTINGQRLLEKMPLKAYAVPAGVPLTIRAYNPFTGLSAERTLVIENNQKKLVELILGINKK
jgi:eukaryotic-like serine/threonine-protein kinase